MLTFHLVCDRSQTNWKAKGRCFSKGGIQIFCGIRPRPHSFPLLLFSLFLGRVSICIAHSSGFFPSLKRLATMLPFFGDSAGLPVAETASGKALARTPSPLPRPAPDLIEVPQRLGLFAAEASYRTERICRTRHAATVCFSRSAGRTLSVGRGIYPAIRRVCVNAFSRVFSSVSTDREQSYIEESVA